jgi:hypothetical protein
MGGLKGPILARSDLVSLSRECMLIIISTVYVCVSCIALDTCVVSTSGT